MTDNDSYYEICIALDSAICAELWDIVASEIADFTNEGLEFAESGAIIIRTSQNAKFINALLAHLQGVCKDLSAINNQNIIFSHTIEVKQNRDWIAEYKSGIKPLRCGRFYIYPPWEKPLVGNSSLGMQFRTCEKFLESTDSGLVLSQNFSQIQKPHRNPKDLRAKRSNQYFDFDSLHESTTNQTKNAESTLDSAKSQNLGENSEKNAESTLDSANQNNPSLRANPQDLRGNPLIEKTQNPQGGWLLRNARKFYELPRSHSLARNDNIFLDSSLRKCSAQNDNFSADSATRAQIAESSLDSTKFVVDSAISKQEANSSIFDEKSGLRSHERGNRTDEFIDEANGKLPDLSPQDEFATINIMLEPSLAFGTGHHSSTFMCIEAIQALHAQDSLKNKKLLDFGCGSGILALCASKLGAVVDLCDIDESAIIESKKNFNNNNAKISHIWQGGIADRVAKKGGIYDIIMANIIASVLIKQKDNIALSLKRGGIAVLSGILDIYKDEVLARFSDFAPLAICQSDEWICAVLQKA